MAKIRVYELARELNMTNKVLLDRLEEMAVEVKSHMSSLDDDTIARIKAELFGKQPKEVVETRIRPTVIRRRRKLAPPSEGDEAFPKEAEAAEFEEFAEPEGVTDEGLVVEPEAATILARPEAKAVEPSEPRATPLPETPGELPSEAPVEAQIPVAPEAAEEATESLPAAEEAAKEIAAEEAPAPETIASAPTESEVAGEAGPKKRLKKAKKEPAAKIIKLPAHPVEMPADRDRRPTEEVPAVVAPSPADATAVDDKKKKRKRKGEEEEPDRKFFKKKISFLKKSVVEGADLYDASPRMRKGRRDAKAKAAPAALKTQITTAKAIKRRLKIDETIVLAELAKRMGIKAGEIIKHLMGMGIMATVNQGIDFETATLIASEFNYEVEKAAFEEETVLRIEEDDPDMLAERAPVVTIMGHVDHGKTSLLDAIRRTKVTEQEAGGITQHIGAYSVATPKGRITFLDTPGHEAFTAMRSRGAKVTDIVVLVVAADDGVMPQTVEAINHARASSVPIIVAVNKIDKDNANLDRVYRELAENGLNPEDWGGDTIFVKVSAKQKIGIEDLLEMVLLQAEVMELKANPRKLAYGHVVEAKLDSGRGPVATVLVKEGTLRAGDPVVCGVHYGKVRAMLDDLGDPVTAAGPSMPVEVIGLSGVPVAGDELVALKDEKDARQVSQHRTQKQRSHELTRSNRMSLENLFEKMKEEELKDLNLIIKADVDGSMEALRDSLTKLSNEEVKINIIHSATGTISESDVSLAAVSNAIIIGFNVRPTTKVISLAAEEQVDMRFHNVIYDVIKEVKAAIAGMMDSTFEERVLGRADVRQTFHVPKLGTIAGCYVTDGKIERGQRLRLLRDGVIHYQGRASSLRRFKDDVKEVQSGYECGIGIENFNDIKVGDVIECFYLEEIRPEVG
jgi:translation initiation factor IF-2